MTFSDLTTSSANGSPGGSSSSSSSSSSRAGSGSGSGAGAGARRTDSVADFDSFNFAAHEFSAGWMDGASGRRDSLFKRAVDSLRPDPRRMGSLAPKSYLSSGSRSALADAAAEHSGADGRVFDAELAARATADVPLLRRLKGRHLQMIAFGGSIGTGLFVSSGHSLQIGGPGSLVLAFILIGGILYSTMNALGELSVTFPVAGSFNAFSTRFLDPAWGFAMGWNYALQWLIALPLETVSASLVIGYWDSPVPSAAWVTIFLLIIFSINMFGVKGFGEAEFILAIVKVVAIVGFIILGVILNIGGGPGGSYIGGKFWFDPGAFNNGFKGFGAVVVNAAFAFSGTELIGLAAAETSNPRKTIPNAVRHVFWRIAIFYVTSLTIVGTLIPYTDPRLLGSSKSDTHSSPFVIAITNAGIRFLDSFMNAVIMLAVLSVGNSAVYGSSRILLALAEQRQAPALFAYVDRRGRPLVSMLCAAAFGLLAYLAITPAQQDVFSWLLALSGLSSVFSWGSICLAHIRFRRAWRVQGHTLEELAFRSTPGLVGSWIGFVLNLLVLVTQIWQGIFPIGSADQMASQDYHFSTADFFKSCLCFFVVLILYLVYKLYFRTPFMRSKHMDLRTGRRSADVYDLLDQEKRHSMGRMPFWKRMYLCLC